MMLQGFAGFLAGALLSLLFGWAMLAKLHVITDARKPGLSLTALLAFLLGAIIGAIVLATSSDTSPALGVLVALVIACGGAGGSLAGMALALWFIDHTFWGNVNLALFEIMTPQVREAARRKPLCWLAAMGLPRDRWPEIRG